MITFFYFDLEKKYFSNEKATFSSPHLPGSREALIAQRLHCIPINGMDPDLVRSTTHTKYAALLT